MLRRTLNGGLHVALGAATTIARAEPPPPPPVATTQRAPPPRQTLLTEHIASTAELNELLDALAADRAFRVAVAHAMAGRQTPRPSHSPACARRASRRPIRLVLLLRLANCATPHPGALDACADRNATRRRTCAAIAVLDGATPRPVAPGARTNLVAGIASLFCSVVCH